MADVTAPEKTPVVLDRALIEALFKKLDASLSTAAFDAIYAAAGTTDEARNKYLFNALRKLLKNDSSALDETKIGDIRDALNAAIDGGIKGTLLSLGQLSAQDILSRGQTDLGMRYAMSNLLPFALVGTTGVYDQHNQGNQLNRFNPNTGEQLWSDAYLKDRADFIAVRLATPEGSSTVSGTQSWIFEDRREKGADGQALRITTTASEAERATNRMIFGSDDSAGEVVSGGNGNDRLYGMGGDDIMRGGAGDDYLEGGQGNDFLQGGRGDDQLDGGAGEDELAGDAGNDILRGGAGVDDLTGGAGDDRMEGGEGFDSYVINTGDGNDVIVDSDGKGEVLLDGVALTGSATVSDGKYKTADGKYSFTFSGDPNEGGTLTIEWGEENARQSVRIHQFKNGQMGITLGDGSADALLMAPTTYTTVGQSFGERKPLEWSSEGQTAVSALPDVAGESYSPGVSGGNADSGVESSAVSASSSDSITSLGQNDLAISSLNPAGNAVRSPVSGLFSDPLANIRYVTGASISQAVAQSDTPFFAGAQYSDAAEGGVSAFITPSDLAHALLDFQSRTVLEDGLMGDNASTPFDNALLGSANLDKLGQIDTSISTRLKPAEIGLGKVGLK